MAQRIEPKYNGTISFNEDESEYTEAEYSELITALNEKIFEGAE